MVSKIVKLFHTNITHHLKLWTSKKDNGLQTYRSREKLGKGKKEENSHMNI